MKDLRWYLLFGFFSFVFAMGVFLTINYFLDKAKYSESNLYYESKVQFMTMYDVLTSNYTYISEKPKGPSFPYHSIGFILIGSLGFGITKFLMEKKQLWRHGKTKRTKKHGRM